ncbi:MAG: flagellar hook assembly protein FlgD [bacterium]|nr:flagellar hook assembly protein FlgD [bacterium]
MSFISPIATDVSGNAKTTGGSQVLGKDDFLQLLVTKLQYQDPLEPMQDEDFIAQLAQFSSLEQMNNIAEGITSSNQWDYLQMQSLNNAMASGLIGKEVQAEYSGIYLDSGKSASVAYTLTQPAKSLTMVIKDADGNEIARVTKKDLGTGSGTITWDGKDAMGNTMQTGYYTVETTATNLSDATFSPSMAISGIVTRVSYRDGSAFVNVNGMEISLGDITAVGEQGSFDED